SRRGGRKPGEALPPRETRRLPCGDTGAVLSPGRRRPDSNRGSKICSLLPYHLATAPTERGARDRRADASPPSDPEREEGAGAPAPGDPERETGLEPATPTLARWCSTN